MIRFSKPCDECGGTGNEMGEFFDCPSCVGGWLPDDEMVEAAASGIKGEYDDQAPWWDEEAARFARLALVAAARYQSERVDA